MLLLAASSLLPGNLGCKPASAVESAHGPAASRAPTLLVFPFAADSAVVGVAPDPPPGVADAPSLKEKTLKQIRNVQVASETEKCKKGQ